MNLPWSSFTLNEVKLLDTSEVLDVKKMKNEAPRERRLRTIQVVTIAAGHTRLNIQKGIVREGEQTPYRWTAGVPVRSLGFQQRSTSSADGAFHESLSLLPMVNSAAKDAHPTVSRIRPGKSRVCFSAIGRVGLV